MASLSLCMIVKNEEDVLERCLESVKGLADEIIIVDTGSDDRTKERFMISSGAMTFLRHAILLSRKGQRIFSCGWTRTM